MQRLGCGAVWSGTVDDDVDMCSRGLCASLFSRASEGGSGGDVYFMTVCGGDRLTRIAIADVAGHGRRVNAVGEWLLAAMKRHMNDHDAPGLLRELNRAAMKYGARAISTVAVVAWDAVRHRLEVASAGHPDVLVSRRGGDFESVPFASRGGRANLPLAVLDNPEFDQVELELEPGDRVAVYSDGVLDLPGSGGERFGLRRLREALDAGRNEPIFTQKQTLLDRLREFSGGELHHDDITLAIIEINAVTANLEV